MTQLTSLQIDAWEKARAAIDEAETYRAEQRLLTAAKAAPTLREGLTQEPDLLLAFVDATGAAVVEGDACTLIGKTPTESQVREIFAWLNSVQAESGTYSTSELPDEMPSAADFKDRACGLLATQFSPTQGNYVLWFRPETIENIEWGGEPAKSAEMDSEEQMTPRRSFEIWREIVAGRSTPWDPVALDAAVNFRSNLLEIVLRRTEEREKAERIDYLARSIRDLDEFAQSVAHDLQTPLRHLHAFTELLQQSEAAHLSNKGREYTDTIIEAAVAGQKIVGDMLDSARLASTEMHQSPVDVDELVRRLYHRYEKDIKERAIDWRMDTLLPAYGDKTLLQLAFQNLIDNALKFSVDRSPAVIEVSCRREGSRNIYIVRDNGVGFDSLQGNRLFTPFSRLHSKTEFEGSGLGLSNVRRIAERHHGEVWAESEPGKGATFYLAIPRGQDQGKAAS